ncbi:ABC transporter substrate-binding protein [Frankia tisae]|uniref:ABC transporter substrate-binding protein n=1 Tax=Frankia tisae TaxID=2950104 RepID=UPI0021C04ACB|nr:ABC transporter substrate-binding protein [Frankia tisae]
MIPRSTWRRARLVPGLVGTSVAVLLAACGSSGSASSSPGSPASSGRGGSVVIGTTDKVTSLDPAGAFDAGSGTVAGQVYARLLERPAGSSRLRPSLATSAGFSSPSEYKVVLKAGLKFANGDPLTSADVKFSFDRQLKIASTNGPSSLLYNLGSVETPDDTTAVFRLKAANDQVFPQVLASGAGIIVDKAVFSATAVTPDATILAKKPFNGPYTINTYKANELVQFTANPNYQGVLGKPGISTVNLRFFASEDNLKLGLQQGDIDLASRSLSITALDALGKDSKLTVYHGAATGIQYIAFNYKTQPFGTGTAEADPKKALAVRQAVAHALDRKAISNQVYRGTYGPLYTFLPTAVPGGSPVLKSRYGDGQGGADTAKAADVLRAAGVSTPVTLRLQYNVDHYGASSTDSFALIKSQLEATGLFTVNLQSTDWVQYSKERVADSYPAFQLGWYADYLDAQDFFQPLYGDHGFIGNHYSDPALISLIEKQATTSGDGARDALSLQIQTALAAELPIVPLVESSPSVVADKKVSGIQQALATGGLPFGALKPGS